MALTYRDGVLHLDGHSIMDLARDHGTPLYIYSQHDLITAGHALDSALVGPTPHLICYAVKANPNLAVIQTFARLGFGADVTSGGELHRALLAGVPPERIVYSGVGKTVDEIGMALLCGIRAFHVESRGEMEAIAAVAASQGAVAPVALRVNVNVDPHTHPGISTGQQETKFGIAWDQVPALRTMVTASASLKLVGLSVHIGSQITELVPYREAADLVVTLARELLVGGAALEYIDFGGGLGVRYDDESPPGFEAWGRVLRDSLGDLPLTLVVEPGRSLVAGSGVLITHVLYIKKSAAKTFVIVDAGMNDLLRPMLYGAYHPIRPIHEMNGRPTVPVDVVGPVCETTDIFAAQRVMALPQPGDLLAITQAGAYGSSMASNYNSRRRPAEVMIGEEGAVHVIRKRETADDLVRGESLLL
jgi:diaminopimelate decarboxylase